MKSPMESDPEGAAIFSLWSAVDGIRELDIPSEKAMQDMWLAARALQDMVQMFARKRRGMVA